MVNDQSSEQIREARCVETFRENGFNEIEGWCSSMLFDSISVLDGANINKIGGCLEIGVHHGKFFILMNSYIDATYKSYAIDIFDNQKINIDHSGAGNLSIFKNNLQKYDAHRGENTVIIIGDSTDSSLKLKEKVGFGSMRFISIDGGHTAEHTISDLYLSTDLISNEGVVILDDILNCCWLGVIEGVGKFLERSPTLVPFAIGHNKLYLSKLSYQKFYFDLFASSQLAKARVKFYGHPLIVLK